MLLKEKETTVPRSEGMSRKPEKSFIPAEIVYPLTDIPQSESVILVTFQAALQSLLEDLRINTLTVIPDDENPVFPIAVQSQ